MIFLKTTLFNFIKSCLWIHICTNGHVFVASTQMRIHMEDSPTERIRSTDWVFGFWQSCCVPTIRRAVVVVIDQMVCKTKCSLVWNTNFNSLKVTTSEWGSWRLKKSSNVAFMIAASLARSTWLTGGNVRSVAGCLVVCWSHVFGHWQEHCPLVISPDVRPAFEWCTISEIVARVVILKNEGDIVSDDLTAVEVY